MNRIRAFTCLLLACSMPALGLEGKLPKELKQKIDGHAFTIILGQLQAKDVAKSLTKLGVVKVEVSPDLGKKRIKEFKMTGMTVLQGAENLSKQVGGKTFANGTSLYISKKPPAAAGGGKKVVKPPPKEPPKKKASSKAYAWTSSSFKACCQRQKPILLYIYDESAKSAKSFAAVLENKLLKTEEVKESLKGFTCVRLKTTAKNWPAKMVNTAKKGAALFLMDCEGTFYGSWNQGTGAPSASYLVRLAKRAEKGNKLKLMLANKFKPKDTPKKEEPKVDKDDPFSGGIPGLDDRPSAKKDDKKKEKKPEVQQPDEEDEED